MNYFPFCETGSQSCKTGGVYDLMADMGVLFFLVHLSTGLQRRWKALWTKLCRQTLAFYEYDRLKDNFKNKWLVLPLNILCCCFKSAPQTERQPCFQVVIFPAEWAAVSVEETQKGWVRDPISSGGRRGNAPLWKGCMERSAGIPWGSCWAALCRSAMTKQPRGLQAVTAGLGCNVYSERTLNPALPPRLLCFPSTSDSDSLHHHSHPSCRKQLQHSPFASFWCELGRCDPESRWERREDFCSLVFICPPSHPHGYQADCAKVGPSQ